MPPSSDTGWAWFAPDQGRAPRPDADDTGELARACARLFAGPDGRRLRAHLRRSVLERVLGPDAPEALLRHAEGQRALVLALEALAARGRTDPSLSSTTTLQGDLP